MSNGEQTALKEAANELDTHIELTKDTPRETKMEQTDSNNQSLEFPTTDSTHSSSAISKSPTFTPSTALQNQTKYRIDPQKWRGLFRGYVRQDWHTINVEDGVDELRAHWAELFFDLIYVACIVHLSTEAAYSIPSDTSQHRRLAETSETTHEPTESVNSYCEHQWEYAFILVTFAQFGLLTNAWIKQVMYITHFVCNQMMDDFLRLWFMICVLSMGIFIKDNESYHRAFLISFQWLKFVEILMFLKVALIPRAKWHAIWHISVNVIFIIIVFGVLIGLDNACAMDYFAVYVTLFVLGSVHYFFAHFVTKCCNLEPPSGIPLNVPHISERVGLFVMIILGESIISVMTSELGELNMSEQFAWDPDGSPPSQILVIFVLLSFVMSYSIARLYFDCQPAEESIMIGNGNHALRISAPRGIAYMKAHDILFGGLLGFGMGLKISGKHVLQTERRAIDVVLPSYSLVVVIIALNIIRMAHPYRVHYKVWICRAILLIVMIVLPIFWETVNHGAIFLVICVCVELQLWLDVEGKEKKKKDKEELKEKRELAKQEKDANKHSNVDDRFGYMKRIGSGVGKL